MSELRLDVRFVDDTQAIAFLELEIIFLSLVEVVQRSHYEVRCQTASSHIRPYSLLSVAMSPQLC